MDGNYKVNKTTMKLEKLLTLSGFVKLIGYGGELGTTKTLATIIKCDKFLDQKPVKGMFVNELEKPDPNKVYTCGMSFDTDYNAQCDKWEAAEKKVIFKECEYFEDDRTINIEFGTQYQFSCWKEDNPTLHDLAEATKGELELQNIEL